MHQELEREPTIDELADRVGLPPDRVREILRISQDPLSLDSPVGEEDDSNLGDFIQDAQRRHARPTRRRRRCCARRSSEALGELSEREQEIVRHALRPRRRSGEDARRGRPEFGVTRERIRQIEAKTLAKLRHPSAARSSRSSSKPSDPGSVSRTPAACAAFRSRTTRFGERDAATRGVWLTEASGACGKLCEPNDLTLSCRSPSGVAQLAEQRTVNPRVAGSSPAPGARDERPASAGRSSFSALATASVDPPSTVATRRGGSSVVRAGDS